MSFWERFNVYTDKGGHAQSASPVLCPIGSSGYFYTLEPPKATCEGTGLSTAPGNQQGYNWHQSSQHLHIISLHMELSAQTQHKLTSL